MIFSIYLQFRDSWFPGTQSQIAVALLFLGYSQLKIPDAGIAQLDFFLRRFNRVAKLCKLLLFVPNSLAAAAQLPPFRSKADLMTCF